MCMGNKPSPRVTDIQYVRRINIWQYLTTMAQGIFEYNEQKRKQKYKIC